MSPFVHTERTVALEDFTSIDNMQRAMLGPEFCGSPEFRALERNLDRCTHAP
jgi:hypothetical protein